MLKNFKTYQLALKFHETSQILKVPYYLKDQLLRASSSVCLNIAEGSGKSTAKDQRRFYAIALGSLRECSAIFDLTYNSDKKLRNISDQLGACLYRLCHPKNCN